VAPSLVVAVGAGCGRFGFDPGADPGAGRDASAPLFADSFEGALDPWTALGTVSVSGGPPAPVEGTSMLVAQAGSAESARAEVELAAPVTTGSLFVRAYYYLPSGYPITDVSILEIAQAGDNLALTNTPEIGVYTAIDPPESGVSTYVLPRDVWTCVEARVGLADATGTWDVWVDGALRHSVADLDTIEGGIDQLYVGITWNGPDQVPTTVYVDAVVADTFRIGCL
jgi:hypothetical protein